MKQREEEAIVLEVRGGRDADRTVIVLSHTGELVPALAPGAARSRRRFGGALQPGARIRARWTVRREGSLAILDEAQLLADPPRPDPLERFYAASHVLEVVRAFAREGAEDPRLYRLLDAALARIEAGAPIDVTARYVEAWVLRLAGLLPELAACSVCGESLARRAVMIAAEHEAFCTDHAVRGARRLGPAGAAWLTATRTMRPDALAALPASAELELADLLTAMIEGFTEQRLRAWGALVKMRRQSAGENR